MFKAISNSLVKQLVVNCTEPTLIRSVEMTRPSPSCAKLSCSLVSSTTSSYWARREDGDRLQTGGRLFLTLEHRDLVICDGTSREAGQYCCVVNAAGRRYSKCITVPGEDRTISPYRFELLTNYLSNTQNHSASLTSKKIPATISKSLQYLHFSFISR